MELADVCLGRHPCICEWIGRRLDRHGGGKCPATSDGFAGGAVAATLCGVVLSVCIFFGDLGKELPVQSAKTA